MSADDIQKAKMRAMHMQSKYGKAGSSSTGTNEINIEGLKKPLIAQADVVSYTGATKSLISQADGASSLPMVCASPNTKEQKEHATLSSFIFDKSETPVVPKKKMDPTETPMEKCMQIRIRWQKPPGKFLFRVFLIVALADCYYCHHEKNGLYKYVNV